MSEQNRILAGGAPFNTTSNIFAYHADNVPIRTNRPEIDHYVPNQSPIQPNSEDNVRFVKMYSIPSVEQYLSRTGKKP